MPPTFEEVNTQFAYAPGEGVLIRKKCYFKRYEGTYKAYGDVSINDHPYQVHRVIWLLKTGKWPELTVDHADRDNKNNRWVNLREATSSQQLMNAVRVNIVSGARGVWLNPKLKKKPWMARIRINKVNTYLGYFATKAEAAEAYRQAAIKYHGEFACTETR